MKRIAAILALSIVTSLHAQNTLLRIPTANTEIVLTVNDDGALLHNYYGAKFDGTEHFADIAYNPQPDAGTGFGVPAYPAYGGYWHITPALKLVYGNGVHSADFKYKSHTITEIKPGVTATDIYLTDTVQKVNLVLHFKAYENEDVITQAATLTNNGKKTLTIESMASAYLPINAQSYYLTHLHGEWAAEAQLVEERLTHGSKTIESLGGVQSTQTASPSFLISLNGPAYEDYGQVYAGSLAWSGNFKNNFEIDQTGTLNIITGANDFASTYYLDKGKSFSTPEMIWTYSNAGKGQASRNLHDWVRNHNLAHADIERPIVLNSWEGAGFNFDEDIIKKLIDDADEIGVEMFVLDDGWFANGEYARNGANAGLGDWQVNTAKLPNGIDALTQHAVDKGLKFGIWIEPEMVNPKSQLAQDHPEWIVGAPGRDKLQIRNQWVLDLSNPAVQDFIVKSFNDVLALSPDISYVKWDANRFITDFGSSYLTADKQSHFWNDYVNGLYSVYERIRAEHPDVMIQLCSAGGGRLDMGALKYHDEFWPSDNTNPLDRIYIQNATNLFFPAIATAAHVSTSPNHQTGMMTPLKYRFDVAMAGRLGLELLPSQLSGDEREFARNAIATYKKIRPIVQFGDLYRLSAPETGRAALQYVAKDKSKAVAFMFNTKFQSRSTKLDVKLLGLNPNKKYKITELNLEPDLDYDPENPYISVYDGKVLSGSYLINAGLSFWQTGYFDSMVLLLEEVK